MVRCKNNYDMTDGLIYMKGLYEHWERDYYIELQDVEVGKYLAYIEFDWHETVLPSQKYFSVTCYGPGKTVIHNVTKEFDKVEFLSQVFLAKLKQSERGLHKTNFQDKGAKDIERFAEFNYP